MRQYLDLMQDILDNGEARENRTGIATLSVFGRVLRFSLEDGFPLLTTKKLHFRSIANELLWFLNGGTNTRWLNERGVSIWDEWADSSGELGPIYGQQWTNWQTSSGERINQIDYVLRLLRHNPTSRRILFHGWNPEFLPDESMSPQENVARGRMALPPCHLLYQFYAGGGDRLSATLYIRSSDVFLGLPYNIASLALLVHLFADQCDLTPHEVIIITGDTHLYDNHRAQIEEQLRRQPHPLPTLEIARRGQRIYDYRFEDFTLHNYTAEPAIAADIAV